MAIHKPHYLRPNKEAFYRWLLSHRQANEKTGTRYVRILTAIEIFAKDNDFKYKEIFTDKELEVLLTLEEFVKSLEFDKFCEKYTNNQITAEDAIKVFIKYKMSCVGTVIGSAVWKADSVLYVRRGESVCQKEKHTIIPVTAVLLGRAEKNVELTVNYCKECQKFFIDEESYNIYRKQYDILIGDIRFEKNGKIFFGDNYLADKSPLMLCGYSVSQQTGLSDTERHYIISKMIDCGALTKSEVIGYLRYFIKLNGQKKCNYFALIKWKRDLAFTLYYKENIRKDFLLEYIQKYKQKLKHNT